MTGEKGLLRERERKARCCHTADMDPQQGAARLVTCGHLIRQNIEPKSSGAGGNIQLPTQKCAPGSCLPREAGGPEAAQA